VKEDAMTTIAVDARRPADGVGAGLVTSTLVVARRALLRFVRTPQLVVLGTMQMVVFLVIFRYVFGGAIGSQGSVAYVDFLVPGFVATGVLFMGTSTAIAVAEDREQGFFDRLRSLPIPRASVLLGRSLADTGVLVWILAVATAVGFAVGFRLHGSALEGLMAFGICVVFGFAFGWLFIALGMMSGNAQAAQAVGFMVFPLVFISSAYVPVATLPGWLQAFAEHQPVTSMVDAVRALTMGPIAEAALGHPASYYVSRALLWAAAIAVVAGAFAVDRYRRT
jgi:ABC transporter DrrB family efflux protein